jgi:hypothetical protein
MGVGVTSMASFSRQRGREGGSTLAGPAAPSLPSASQPLKRPRDEDTKAAPRTAVVKTAPTAASSAASSVPRPALARPQLAPTSARGKAAAQPATPLPTVCRVCCANASALSDAVQSYEDAFDAARTAMVEATLRHMTSDETVAAIQRAIALSDSQLHAALTVHGHHDVANHHH